ncbi:hypothetical protein ACFSKU_05335 [Pontibacter silvestris]|uniref:Uncharacterized protein n=1 Tax=Pontibacter silvestris TaxID=2305183 RepID=A0ABW4WVR6_9BACT|nr:hypothetical protein [Pontibacter silvestris]MCC9136961.1 hypothetical protein [Pontibacter silvestris]
MSDNKDNISNELNTHAGVSGQQPGQQTGPVGGSAENTRGENKPSREGTTGGAKPGKASPDKDTQENATTTTRGADSSDKEFRNNQPNASTLKGQKNNEGLGNEK